MKYITLAALINFLVYAITGIGLLGLFGVVYNWITPYNDISEIKKGNCASSITLSGAMLGFTIPLVVLSYIGINIADFLMWSAVVGGIQLVLFKILSKVFPLAETHDNCAVATVYAALSVCIGLIVGFSLIPS